MKATTCACDHPHEAENPMVTTVTDGHATVTEPSRPQVAAPTETTSGECTGRDRCDHCDRRAAQPLAGAVAAHLDHFVAGLRARLAPGAATFGDRSFTRPAVEIVDEIQQELEDVAGWGLLLWTRLERLRQHVEVLDQEGGDRG